MGQAARREFARYGVAAASIGRISESAGFSRGAFYSNFADKHELLLKLLSEHQSEEIAAWRGFIQACANIGGKPIKRPDSNVVFIVDAHK